MTLRARIYQFTFRRYRHAPFDSRRASFWWRLGCKIETKPKPGVDIQALAIRHQIRGHSGEALLCAECVRDTHA